MKSRLLIAILVCCSLAVSAEPISKELAEIQTSSVASALKLDSETAKKFAPLYVDYLNALGRATEQYSEPQINEYSSDAQIEKAIQSRFALTRKTLEIREAYYTKFRQILTPRQLNSLYKNESTFRAKIKRESSRRSSLSEQRSSITMIPSNVRRPISAYMNKRLPKIKIFEVSRKNAKSDCYLRTDNLQITFDRKGKFKSIKARKGAMDYDIVESVLAGGNLTPLKDSRKTISSIKRISNNKYEIGFTNTPKTTTLSL